MIHDGKIREKKKENCLHRTLQQFQLSVHLSSHPSHPCHIPFCSIQLKLKSLNYLLKEYKNKETEILAASMAEDKKLQVPRVKLGTQGLEVTTHF